MEFGRETDTFQEMFLLLMVMDLFFSLSLISFSFDAHNTSHTLLLSLCLLLPNSRALGVYQECQHLKYSVRPGGPPRTLTVLSLLVSMIQAGDASATLPVHYLPPLMGRS